MKSFMDDTFLLNSETAIKLYNDYAKDLPIIDYHCHLNPQEILENKTFKNITEAWLYGDHYKWRLMRANGVDERFITGDASDYDKFIAWARTVPMTIGNPLYNWTHLELQRFFGIHDILNEQSAPKIWEETSRLLSGGGFGARDLIVKSNVRVVCTTDDPVDTLEFHKSIRELADFEVRVLPSFRPDKALEIGRDTFMDWIDKLAGVYGSRIADYGTLLDALENRVRFFHSAGGRVSDHAIDVMMYAETTEEEVSSIFAKVAGGQRATLEEEKKYKAFTLNFLGKLYAELGWTMQLHINALRNNNSRMFGKLGPDTGYDSLNDQQIAKPLVGLLDSLDRQDALPKTILYSLNPNDNTTIAAIVGSFQGGGTAGKIQFGTAWWFNDNKEGMLDQMKALSNVGLISRFVGMLTDSRSFLSYTRHEYFRRILCDLLASWIENGEVPNDLELVGGIVRGIAYENAEAYFGFPKPAVVR
ncbi:glucuronate isomerase [Saccharibacillus sp. CPCC 101409]|uniref:glucuronate isomerase n=1 Tax=Saccharibacillus sp. CPCC 101409 TaxID=3058041 RepID=UPI00267392B5|nr:glucuronate isomerase [Saccharibacillus sp. CPCC 101409]MDO3410793.1 glucuronate isomerase [Saccharibacillus sp. CPCC 101409]